jgi:hypothetical protein
MTLSWLNWRGLRGLDHYSGGFLFPLLLIVGMIALVHLYRLSLPTA